MKKNDRATKKQRELLLFIDGFIKGNNYGPSYREIMRALGYKSVSTVAIHVNGLIAKGFLRKTDNSARSIEVIGGLTSTPAENLHEVWLIEQLNKKIKSGVSEKDYTAAQEFLTFMEIDTKKLAKRD